MTTAPPCPRCGAPPGARPVDHRTDCLVWLAAELRARALSRRLDDRREERATGHRRVRGASAALVWYFNTREAWGSAKALPVDPDRSGTGAPNRGADDPKRALFAAVAYAIRLAEEDDRERYPAARVPLIRWLRDHFGSGRAYHNIAEEAGCAEVVVHRRVERALRVVRDRLREVGRMEGGDGE